MPDTYWKVPFTWSGDRRAFPATEPPGTVWTTPAETPGFLDLVGACLAASLDEWDRSAVACLGARRAAEVITGRPEGYDHDPGWWEVLRIDGRPAGFVLPATFTGCARDGLDEATLLHIGVLPAVRGRGLGRILLRRATSTLERHGVWRIYCDTATTNEPMLHLFESEGWTRLPAHERPTFSGETDPPG